jgi:hypothetical protein
LNGFGLNLGIPTGNVVWINNITTKGRKGLWLDWKWVGEYATLHSATAVSWEPEASCSNKVRNKIWQYAAAWYLQIISLSLFWCWSMGCGGYIDKIHFQNIQSSKASFVMNHDGIPIIPNNHYIPQVSNIYFENVTHINCKRGFASCASANNQSKCFNITSDTSAESPWSELLSSMRFYTCNARPWEIQW